MALYVYVTKQCEEDARRHSRYDEMYRLKKKVEQAQRICLFDNFPPPYLKKRFDRQIRLLADYRSVEVGGEEHVIICFLRIYVRSSNEYKSFRNDPQSFGKRFLEPLINEGELKVFLHEQVKECPVVPKQKPSEAEHEMLYCPLGGRTSDEHGGTSVEHGFVCESERWVRSVLDDKLTPMLSKIQDRVGELIYQDTEQIKAEINDYTISFRHFASQGKLFLAGITRTDSELEEIETTYSQILKGDADSIPEELLFRYSMRAYPSLMLASKSIWLDIQKDMESNLALSSEETAVLESVHRSELGFPVFINGCAGSGKSTILYHLFAGYVNRYLGLCEKGMDPGRPILFSCSEDLRQRAQKTVQSLLRCNPKWRDDDESTSEISSECFQEFHSYLYRLLPEDVARNDFPRGSYVDFSRFREIWTSQFGQDERMTKEASADLSWHIIRSYVKGTNPEGFLAPEDYEELPKKQKSVSRAAFKIVYERVWEKWYRERCEKKKNWDDQDLARYVFEHDLIQPVASVVFCDEAQDFTRVELDLLFRISVFADRKLKYSDIPRVPFGFAGDPFQTLNPTGFSWEAIQASFHDKIVDILAENLRPSLTLNYQELKRNYRSTSNIVRLCNLIQSLRAALFDLGTLKPQTTWQLGQTPALPVWFDMANVADWDALKDERDITIIIPCALNEEQRFAASDANLSRIVKKDEQGVLLNVLCPARAKGIEFARVVLYGFGENAPENILSLLDGEDRDQDSLLPLEYFMNQLYVAASRPKRRLFIVDSAEGRERLWRVADDESLQEKMWKRIPNGKRIWSHEIGGFQVGTRDTWMQDRENPEENAKRFEEQGKATRDPYLLRSAALSWESIGNQERASICKAVALSFEKKHMEAGETFSNAGDGKNALTQYWLVGTKAKERILALPERYHDIATRPEFKLMDVLDKPNSQTVLDRMNEIAQLARTSREFRSRLSSENTFPEVLWTYGKGMSEDSNTKEEVRIFLNLIEELVEAGLAVDNCVLAHLHFKTGRFRESIENWERCTNYSGIPEYRQAKAITLSEAFRANPSLDINANETRILIDHFEQNGDYLMMLKAARKILQTKEIVEKLAEVPDDLPNWQDILIEAFGVFATTDDWETIADIALTSLGRPNRPLLRRLSKILKARVIEVRNGLIAVCATNPFFGEQQHSQVLRKYSDYLKDVLIPPAKWKDRITLEAAGCAIERAGRHRDILPFYECVMRDVSFSDLGHQFARERWVATKEKQAKREWDQGDLNQYEKHGLEAAAKRKEYHLPDGELDKFPKVREIFIHQESSGYEVLTSPKNTDSGVAQEASAESEDQSFDIGAFHFDFHPSKSRVNMTHRETKEIAVIRIDRGTFSSTDDIEISATDDRTLVCRQWDCICTFFEQRDKKVVAVEFPDLHMTLSFHLPGSVEGRDT